MANIYKIVAIVSSVVLVLLISLVTILLVALRSTKINCNCFRIALNVNLSHIIRNFFKGDEVDCVKELFQGVKKWDFATVEKYLTNSDVDINSRQNEE